jgi:hypothetical protein
VVRRCRLRLGRGNSDLAVACDGWLQGLPVPAEAKQPPPLIDLRFEENEIDGRFEIRHAQKVHLLNNRSASERGRLTIRNCRELSLEGNRLGEGPWPANRIQITE